MDTPLCKMPWTTECNNPATIAYLDKISNKILYRCHQHSLRPEQGSTFFQESVQQMTVDEAVAWEVMNG